LWNQGVYGLRWRRRGESYGFKADVFSAGIVIRNCLKTPKKDQGRRESSQFS